jgi:uncharacterized protein (UPF0305 family)
VLSGIDGRAKRIRAISKKGEKNRENQIKGQRVFFPFLTFISFSPLHVLGSLLKAPSQKRRKKVFPSLIKRKSQTSLVSSRLIFTV